MKALTFAGLGLAALLGGVSLASAKTLVLLLGRQSGELHPRNQHHRHQLRCGAAGL